MMVDDKGEDAKLICIIDDDPTQVHVNDALTDLSNHTRIVICHFFETYKDLENKWSVVQGIRGREEGHAELIRAIEMY